MQNNIIPGGELPPGPCQSGPFPGLFCSLDCVASCARLCSILQDASLLALDDALPGNKMTPGNDPDLTR